MRLEGKLALETSVVIVEQLSFVISQCRQACVSFSRGLGPTCGGGIGSRTSLLQITGLFEARSEDSIIGIASSNYVGAEATVKG